jgi:hypothetical protein
MRSAAMQTAQHGWNFMLVSVAPLSSYRFRITPLSACVAAIFAVNAAAAGVRHEEIPALRNAVNVGYPLHETRLIPRAAQPGKSSALSRPPAVTGSRGPLSVMNCNDSGPGSLREAIANAATGDTIDLTNLPCSEITLFSDEVHVIVDDLTIEGPGPGQLVIYGGDTAAYYHRIFDHTGVGTLTISGLTLTDARLRGADAKGGCIYTQGSLALENAIVTGCTAEAPLGANSYASAGAIFAREDVSLRTSTISDSTAYSAERGAYGGGLVVRGNLKSEYSTIAGNQAIGPMSYDTSGGGLAVLGTGDVAITGSTISGNTANFAGGMRVASTGSSSLVNSTLAYNVASFYIGGASFVDGSLTISNSTIARNSAFLSSFGNGIYSNHALTIRSSIVADNFDIANGTTLDVLAPAIDGDHDLITAAPGALPTGTITACPRLTGLANHGGSTWTFALIAGSPAINAGSNPIPLDTDQRSGVFPRVFGARADIGAYEWQGELDDSIFRSAFETRCD